MKKILLMCLIFSGLFSCHSDQFSDVNDSEKEAILEMEYYSCTWDAHPSENSSAASDRQRFSSTFAPFPNGCGLKVYINDNCEDNEGVNFYQAAKSALFNYNVLQGTALQLDIVDKRDGSDIAISCNNLQSSCLGSVIGSAIALPGERIPRAIAMVNTDFTGDLSCYCDGTTGALTQCQWIYLLMHELGHILGIGHTDNTALNLIPGTPTEDEFSIFNDLPNSAAFCNGICEFSDGDIAAIQVLYPVVGPAEPVTCECHCKIGDPNGDIYYEEYSYEIDCDKPCWEPFPCEKRTIRPACK